MSQEAMTLALEALEYIDNYMRLPAPATKAITALRQALANEALDKMAENAIELGLDYEPVWGSGFTNKDYEDAMRQRRLHQLTSPPDAFEQLRRKADKPTQVPEGIAKYVDALVKGTHEITSLTIRPKRTWVGLTDDEVDALAEHHGLDCMVYEPFAEAIEAKLREKNA